MTPAVRLAASAAVLLSLAACGGSTSHPSGGPTMRPGEDCLGCHDGFTAAGTVFGTASAAATGGLAGATVAIEGQTAALSLSTNEAGNFYTTQAFGYPATFSVSYATSTVSMINQLPRRQGCAAASCHVASFRIHVP